MSAWTPLDDVGLLSLFKLAATAPISGCVYHALHAACELAAKAPGPTLSPVDTRGGHTPTDRSYLEQLEQHRNSKHLGGLVSGTRSGTQPVRPEATVALAIEPNLLMGESESSPLWLD